MSRLTHNTFKYHLTVSYPCGADFVQCAVCTSYIDHGRCYLYNDTSDTIYFCNKCNNIFKESHNYKEDGCTDGIYHAMTIYRYVYKDLMFTGFPTSVDLPELITSGTLKIISMKCTCNGKRSDECSYPESTHPQYYQKCPGEVLIDITRLKLDR